VILKLLMFQLPSSSRVEKSRSTTLKGLPYSFLLGKPNDILMALLPGRDQIEPLSKEIAGALYSMATRGFNGDFFCKCRENVEYLFSAGMCGLLTG